MIALIGNTFNIFKKMCPPELIKKFEQTPQNITYVTMEKSVIDKYMLEVLWHEVPGVYYYDNIKVTYYDPKKYLALRLDVLRNLENPPPDVPDIKQYLSISGDEPNQAAVDTEQQSHQDQYRNTGNPYQKEFADDQPVMEGRWEEFGLEQSDVADQLAWALEF